MRAFSARVDRRACAVADQAGNSHEAIVVLWLSAAHSAHRQLARARTDAAPAPDKAVAIFAGRLLLVRGIRFRQGRRRDRDHLRLYRRQGGQSDLQAGLGRRRPATPKRWRSTYDPTKVTYQKLLDHFWRNVDPFAKDRQFCDSGEQYRTAIFYHDEEKRSSPRRRRRRSRTRFKKTVETEIAPAEHVLRGRGLSPGLLSEERDQI